MTTAEEIMQLVDKLTDEALDIAIEASRTALADVSPARRRSYFERVLAGYCYHCGETAHENDCPAYRGN